MPELVSHRDTPRPRIGEATIDDDAPELVLVRSAHGGRAIFEADVDPRQIRAILAQELGLGDGVPEQNCLVDARCLRVVRVIARHHEPRTRVVDDIDIVVWSATGQSGEREERNEIRKAAHGAATLARLQSAATLAHVTTRVGAARLETAPLLQLEC